MGFPLFLYNVLLLIGLLVLAPVWMSYLLLVPKARAGFWEKLGFYPALLKARMAQKPRKRIWFHAVSVGEFNAIRSLIPDLQADYDVVVSTTTRTGHELAQRTFPELAILYFPYDVRATLRQAMGLVRPDLVVLTETELWPNFIDVVTRAYRTPLLLINGRLSRKSCRGYHWIRLFMKPCLNQITHLYMQSQSDADRVRQLGDLPPEQLTVVGNLKFDLIPTIDPLKRAALKHLLNINDGDTVLTLASTHSGEDPLLLESYLQLKKDFPELKLILAPRHPERLPEIKGILNGKAVHYAVRSQLSDRNPNQQAVVVLDSIGELLTVYSFSTIAVMGGSFVEKGGQNPLEALSQRVPVIFGPHMHNFAEIRRMILDAQAGYEVQMQTELIHAVTGLLTQPEAYDSVAENGQQLLENNRGARAVMMQAIRTMLGEAKHKRDTAGATS
jgi:3-deoxy-D-manno-octulosonic-acid transferase